MHDNPKYMAFWRRYLATLPEHHPHLTAHFSAWGFGGGAAMADKLLIQVQRGQKTATSSPLWIYHETEKTAPQEGDLHILLDSKDEPTCLIQTTRTNVEPFHNIDAAFARAEGDGTLENWREIHEAYFSEVCEKIGRKFSPEMPVLCEYFMLIYNPPALTSEDTQT